MLNVKLAKTLSLVAGAGLTAALAAGCAANRAVPQLSPSPAEYGTLPSSAAKATAAAATGAEIPEEYRAKKWGLADVIDLALRNNPATRSAWLDAKAASARVGMADAPYYPKVSVDATVSEKFVYRDDIDLKTRQDTLTPVVSLSWLLLDFGGRDANAESSRQALAAAVATHNKLLDDTVLATQKAYYLYFSTKAVREARVKALERAELALKTAEGRHEGGVATISDVLSARTARSQAQLSLDTVDGQIETTRGNLAVAMGFPANIKFDISDAPEDGPYGEIAAEVEALINDALAKRPDLAAARLAAEAAKLQVAKAESDGMPTLSLVANGGLSWIDLNKEATTLVNKDRREDSYFAGVTLSVPLFTGFSTTYNVERARAEAQSAEEKAKTLEQLAISQVFTAFHALKTASKKVRTSDELIKSAASSEEVALGRYKEGVGTMLDLVTAQTALADARTQGISSRWEWKTALAQLAHDSGKLELAGRPASK